MITEDDVAALMRAAADDITVTSAPAEALATAGRVGVRRRRARGVACVAAAAAVAVTVSLQVDSPWASPPPASSPPTTDATVSGCSSPIASRVLPSWARGGFSQPKPRAAYVSGRGGDIVAILFAQPLTAPPPADHNNKILWVSRVSQEPVTDLHIRARLVGGSETVIRRVTGGPGPSTVDLPEPGCWQLTLRWSGHSDNLELAYLAD